MALSSAKTESEALDAIERLGLQLLQSRSNVNNAPVLIAILSYSLVSGSAPTIASSSSKCLIEALTSLQAFFLPLLRSGEISALLRIRARIGANATEVPKTAEIEEHRGAKDEDGVSEEAQMIYTRWLWQKYIDFRNVLIQLFIFEELLLKIRAAALHAYMEFVRTEGPTGFSNLLYSKLCSSIVSSRGISSDALGIWESYYKYADVSYFTYSNLEKLVNRRKNSGKGEPLASEDDDDTHNDSIHTFVHHAYDVLSRLPPPSDDETRNELWSMPEPETKKSEILKIEPASSDKNSPKQISCAWKSSKKQRFKFSRAWLAFLQLDLPLDIYKKVLAELPKKVIPSLTNPIYLSDFLTNSYNVGGLISVMALNGLFILVTKYGLEYPDFYAKLYALLEPSVFVAKHRARFFELLDICLKSSHLPAYLAAAFTKKLGRLGLTASPSGCLVVIAMIHNLLRRHPSINCLVDKQEHVEDGPAGLERELGTDLAVSDDSAHGPLLDTSRGADPFMLFEPDPAKSNALKSSLWEVEAFRRHYCPAVSRFVASLETDLTIRAKTTEVAIVDFSSGSYGTIFSEEVSRRLKQVPLSFYQTVPTAVFPPTANNEFLGWNFESQEGPATSDEVQAVGVDSTTGRTRVSLGTCHATNDEDERLSKKRK